MRPEDDDQIYDESGNRICGAKTNNDGPHDVCHMDAGYGTDHPGFGKCKRHMGSTPTLQKKGFIAMARAMGDPVGIHPADAMERTIAATAGHVFWLEAKIGGYTFPEIVKLDDDGVETIQGMTPNQQMWWNIYCLERDRLVKFCEIALRAGLAQRQVDIAQELGTKIARAIDLVLSRLGLTDVQLQRVPDVVPEVLRGMIIDQPAIEGGP